MTMENKVNLCVEVYGNKPGAYVFKATVSVDQDGWADERVEVLYVQGGSDHYTYRFPAKNLGEASRSEDGLREYARVMSLTVVPKLTKDKKLA